MKLCKVVVTLILWAWCTVAMAAATGGGGGLPWEGGLISLVNSFTGPVAYTVSVLGIVIAIGILIFGNDLNAFGRTIVFLILAASVIVTAANTLQLFTGVGATTTHGSLALLGFFFTLVGVLTLTQELFLRVFRKKTGHRELNSVVT